MTQTPIEDIEEMFDVGGKKTVDSSDDYSNDPDGDMSQNIPFDKLADEVSDKLQNSGEDVPALEVSQEKKIQPEVKQPQEDTKVEEKKEVSDEGKEETNVDIEDEEVSIDVDDIFDSTSKPNTETVEKPVLEEEKTIPKRPVDSQQMGTPNGSSQQGVDQKMKDSYSSDSGQWLLSPPTEKYAHFYRQKSNMLSRLFELSEEIPFKTYLEELKNSSVLLDSENFDPKFIHSQIVQVQRLRERVSKIILTVNGQYFKCKRLVELLRGVLARVEYEKPVIRQEGVVYEHMRDLELYFANLEAMQNSAAQVYKTLEGAYMTLSRQVTVVMGERDTSNIPHTKKKEPESVSTDRLPEQTEQTEPPVQTEKPEKGPKADLTGYDQLTETKVQTEDKKSQFVDWDKIGY